VEEKYCYLTNATFFMGCVISVATIRPGMTWRTATSNS